MGRLHRGARSLPDRVRGGHDRQPGRALRRLALELGNELEHDGRTVASEFVGTSISSGCGWDASVRLGLPANPHVLFYEGGYRGYMLCDVTPARWRTDLRIVTAPRDPASPAYLLAAFEVADGAPGATRLDAGTGIASRVTSAPDGAALVSVQIEVRTGGGGLLVARLTDALGTASVFVPPGTYEVTANGVGFDVQRRTVTVAGDRVSQVDFSLTSVTLRVAASAPWRAADRSHPPRGRADPPRGTWSWRRTSGWTKAASMPRRSGIVALRSQSARGSTADMTVLLLQGDSHEFLLDTPEGMPANLTRIVVGGGPTTSAPTVPRGYLRLRVDPSSAGVFSCENVAFGSGAISPCPGSLAR